ncbi:MAG: hypothetical protein ACKOXK_05345 [Chakrabartia sp.]
MQSFSILGAALLMVAGCDTNNDRKATAREAGAAIDQTANAASDKVDDVGRDLDRAGDRAAADAREAGRDAKEAGRDAIKGVEKGADKVERAADAAGRELKKDK